MIKLIATDMDGTFLDSHKMFDFEFITIFHKLMEKNISFVIASGNQFLRLYHQFIPMSEDMYFISENGAYITKGSQVIYSDTMNIQDVHEIIKIVESHKDLYCVLSGMHHFHVHKKDEQLVEYLSLFARNIIVEENFDEIHDQIFKITVGTYKGDIHEYESFIRTSVDQSYSVITSGNEFIDIQNGYISKGEGMKILQQKLNIAPFECMAFGDAMNDESLLRSVKYSYAMENADPRIKDIAYDVTSSNDEQGVLKVIKRLLERY